MTYFFFILQTAILHERLICDVLYDAVFYQKDSFAIENLSANNDNGACLIFVPQLGELKCHGVRV